MIWTGALVYTYLFLNSILQTFAVAAVIAVALGGSQALSRSAWDCLRGWI